MLPSVYFYFVFHTTVAVVRGSNILIFMPIPIKSHFRGFQPMFEELARRGHNVTVASSFPLDRPIANYTDIGPFVSKNRVRNLTDLIYLNFMTMIQWKWYLGVKLFEEVMSHKNMKEFIQSNSNSFDLVMIETFCQEYTVSMGHKFNATVINLAPAILGVSVSKWLQIPSTFSYIPDYGLKTTDEMSFIERLKNTIVGIMQMYIENYVHLPKMKEIMNTHFTYKGWESRPSLENMLRNVSLTLVNSHFTIGIPRPYYPGVIEVGGMHIKEPKPLPENLQLFLDSAAHGVIFFSFGTVVNLNDIPTEKLNIFLNVIGKLKQKVIIKWTPHCNLNLSQNILIDSWFPQNDILAHPKVKLFITHGGLHSLEETIYHMKPVVGIPFFADQYFNMKLAEKNGFGKLVNYFEMTEKSFGNTIKEVMSNSKFKKKIEIQSQVYKDQPMKPLDRAVYWVEYIIRNGGAEHLKSYSLELNDFQYFLFDVSLLLFMSTILISGLCYLVIRKIASKIISTT